MWKKACIMEAQFTRKYYRINYAKMVTKAIKKSKDRIFDEKKNLSYPKGYLRK